MRYIHSMTMWELALYIAIKLNKMSNGFERFALEPEDVLRKAESREELEFYYGRLCCD